MARLPFPPRAFMIPVADPDPHPFKGKRAIAVLICFALLALGCAIHFAHGYSLSDQPGHGWGCDDAFIAYRYAKHFAQGLGLVFNQGERVEGHSSLLYVILLTPVFFMLDGMNVYYASVVLNGICVCVAFLLFVDEVCRRIGTAKATGMAFLFALCPPMWAWVASGLETSLVLLLQIIAWVDLGRIERDGSRVIRWLLFASLAASILARPEGVLLPRLSFI